MEEFAGCKKNLPFKLLSMLTAEKLETTKMLNLPRVYHEMFLNIALLHILIAKNFDSKLANIQNTSMMKFNSPEQQGNKT